MSSRIGIDVQASATPMRGASILLLLGALVALGPLSTDAYVPGLPRLADDLHTTASLTQLTVTTCLLGLAVGQLLAGPLSDALGRRWPLLIGLAIYTVAGLLCAVAPNVATLILFRGIQGVGGAFALVIAYASVRDRSTGKLANQFYSRLLLVTGLAPILAPLVGAQILRLTSWRGIFIALAALSACVFLACLRSLPESLPRNRRETGGLRASGAAYAGLLADRRFVSYVLMNALVFASMFAYVSGSPFVLENIHGLSPQQYSIVFAVNAFGLVAAAQASGRLVRHIDARVLLGSGVVGSATGGIALLVIVVIGTGLWPVLVAFFVVVTSVGVVLPNAAALALEDHGAHAGTAAALLGCAQFLLGGLAAPLVGILGDDSALPMAAVMAALGILAAVTLVALKGPAVSHRRSQSGA